MKSRQIQLDRYLLMMMGGRRSNCSITVSGQSEEVPAIVDWLYEHWDGTLSRSSFTD